MRGKRLASRTFGLYPLRFGSNSYLMYIALYYMLSAHVILGEAIEGNRFLVAKEGKVPYRAIGMGYGDLPGTSLKCAISQPMGKGLRTSRQHL